MRKPWLVLLLALAGTLLVLAAEGLASLAWGGSLLRGLVPRAPAGAPSSAQGNASRAARVGPYRVPSDPFVSYTLQPGRTLDFEEGAVVMRLQTDALGLRARHGAPVAEGALRIVVLGDSVAFGFGLADEDTLAAQLERLLAESVPGPAPACFTVALPSWNTRNAWRFLRDHWAELRPDIVLYLPVANDLEDGYGVTETGQRRSAEDPASDDPLLCVRPERGYIASQQRERREAPGALARRLGPEVLEAGLGPTARARYRALAREIAEGQERLARAGARLALVSYQSGDFRVELRAELARQGTAVTEIALIERLQASDTLGIDPHPSAATTAAFARWIVAALLDEGWLPAGTRAPPAAAAALEARRAGALGPAEAQAQSAERRARQEGELRAQVSSTTLEGLLQVLGGLNLDGTIEARFATVLPPGRALGVRLAPIEARADLYPLEVRVRVNGRLTGTLVVPPTGEVAGRFALEGEALEAPFDVQLEADDWTLLALRGRSWVAAARFLELESTP